MQSDIYQILASNIPSFIGYSDFFLNIGNKKKKKTLQSEITPPPPVLEWEQEDEASSDLWTMSTKIRRILLIHADNALKDILLLCLETISNYEIITASSAIEGLEKALDVDAVLLDIEETMPDIYWQEIVQSIKQNSATNAVPLILLTAIPQSLEMLEFQQQREIKAIPSCSVNSTGERTCPHLTPVTFPRASAIFVIAKSFNLLNLASQISILLDDS